MITVCSGGQQGTDIVALRSAKAKGITTSGYIPIGYLTLDGPKPEYKDLYGLVEYGKGYKERTWKNVESADLTIRIATDFNSAGEKCTWNAISRFNKPSYDINPNVFEKYTYLKQMSVIFHCASLIFWYCGEDGMVNFAGNTEKTSPGIEKRAYRIVDDILYYYTQARSV